MQCLHCNKTFTAKRSDAKFCSGVCRSLRHRSVNKCNKCISCGKDSAMKKYCDRKCQKQHTEQKKWNSFQHSKFGRYLLQAINKAGTVEILANTEEYDLHQLYKLFKYRNKANGVGFGISYHLCHLSPAVTETTLGLLHHVNLLVAEGRLNQSLGNTDYGHPLYLLKEDCLDKWKVSGLKNKEILELADNYLQGDLREFALQYNFPKIQQQNDTDYKLESLSIHDVLLHEGKRYKAWVRDSSVAPKISKSIKRLEKDKEETVDDWLQFDNLYYPKDFQLDLLTNFLPPK